MKLSCRKEPLSLKDWSFVLMWLCLYGCVPATTPGSEILNSPFFGFVPTETPQLLAPDQLASALIEYNGTFSPNGTEFYFTCEVPLAAFIAFMRMNPDGSWSDPVVAEFSGEYSDYDPIFSPDGARLYFSSRRPTDSTLNKRSNIWFVERVGETWTAPQYQFLTTDGDYYSSITSNGTIYFNTNGDIFRALKTDSAYTVERLDDTINSPKGEADPFISPDEDYLIFRSYRDDGFGGGDLYVSFNIDGQWTKPENLGEPINSKADESCPYITADGKLLVYASRRAENYLVPEPLQSIKEIERNFQSYENGLSNIYAVSADFIQTLKLKHSTTSHTVR